MNRQAFRTKVFKWLRRLALGFVVLLLFVAMGRPVQIYLDSQYHGERGPYLQMLGHDSVTIHWQTSQAEAGMVRFGLQPDRLDRQVKEAQAGEKHQVRLTGLKPATRYWYSVGAAGQGGNGEAKASQFSTAPPPGSDRPSRIWVLGDPGYVSDMVEWVRDSALEWMDEHPRTGGVPLDLILTTGDNAYRSGKNREFQAAVFDIFGDLLKRYPYWPAYGNHDARRWAYFDIFNFPEQGELGGEPSGTENYFSFDYANIHFVFLDSEDSDRDADGAMAEWLRRDLSATRQQWLIAVFHHPPYTKGSHDSDDPFDSRGRQTDMRENIVPLLEQAGVDLVLSGHSHVYERSHLLDCHYGKSTELQADMVLDTDGVFEKRGERLSPHAGAVYAVVGASGHINTGTLDHPVMAFSKSELGSLIVDVEGTVLRARYINQLGEEVDRFSITKGVATAVKRSGSCSPSS